MFAPWRTAVEKAEKRYSDSGSSRRGSGIGLLPHAKPRAGVHSDNVAGEKLPATCPAGLGRVLKKWARASRQPAPSRATKDKCRWQSGTGQPLRTRRLQGTLFAQSEG